MATEDKLREDRDNSIDSKGVAIYNIINCKQCKWNGFPNEKIFVKFDGLRPEDEDGFIYKFEEVDCQENGKINIHKHKFDLKVIGELVDHILSQTKVTI